MPPVIQISDQFELVPTKKFPKYAHFPFEYFNPVQSRVFEVFDKDANLVIAAATSSGKTICAEQLMAHEVRVKKRKAIYLAPLKALAKEKIDDWQNFSHHFSDLKLSILTGDYTLTDSRKKELQEADIILMTSEMLGSRVRNFDSEKNEFLKEVGIVISDESHLISVPGGRGDKLEVGMMKFSKVNPNAKYVLLSATMPNVREIAEWIAYELTGKTTYLLNSEYRPCPLEIHYEPHDEGRNYDATEEFKIRATEEILERYPDDKFLVFVHTKRTGQNLLNRLKMSGYECEFHSADLEKSKREDLEKRFREKKLNVLIATSTLAWGCYKFGSRLLGDHGRLIDVSKVKKGTELLCLDGNEFKPKKVVHTESFKAKYAYRVELESGEKMKVSEDHIFKAAFGRNKPDWVKVSDLKKGDFIATPSDLGIWKECQNFDVFWYLVGFAFGDGCISKSGMHADGNIKLQLDLCLGEYNKHAYFIRDLFNKEFKSNSKIRNDSNGVPHIVNKTRSIVEKFSRILPIGRKKGKDDLPTCIYDNPKMIVNFLSGWFDADGGVEDHGSYGNMSVGLTCISRSAIESARALLLCFGIRCSFGRKRMKDTVINGRLQKAKRRWLYRLRIFGKENLEKFQKFVGFKHVDKVNRLKEYINSLNSDKLYKDLIPARVLLKEHVEKNGLRSKDYSSITGGNRKIIEKLLNNTTIRTELNDIFEFPVYWSRIKKVEKVVGGKFMEIEVEFPHNYVGCNAISHNCNFPARRVIIVGVHRGLDVVENYDITQEVGRAGRPGFDNRGDAHVLLPNSSFSNWKKVLSTPAKIKSRLLDYIGNDKNKHYKTLAFHIVSEIHHGEIKTKKDMVQWYKKSLAHFQAQDLDDEIIESTLSALLGCGAIREEDGEYKTSMVGTVASMFYCSPFDISDWRKNFQKVFDAGNENNDLFTSIAFGNIDTIRMGIVSRAERDAMALYAEKVKKLWPGVMDTAIKGGYVYYCLMNGLDLGAVAAFGRNLQYDFPRTAAVFGALDDMVGNWGAAHWIKRIQLRIQYGVKDHLVELCQIPNIGKVRAEKLFSANLRTWEDVANKPFEVQRVLNMKESFVREVCLDAKKLILTN